ncbi:hypothetical protein Cgig2_020645 [Carnegiea gigantea]|uniref:non-specific serine/threonine protein kinase n=1 Tax=Carnegiea gigantea TaxID=171969 RepID=A0A9Q1JZ20_9CARY|nr:hypothetical protein Cgig2_020645 [Carnegiea gigantea]
MVSYDKEVVLKKKEKKLSSIIPRANYGRSYNKKHRDWGSLSPNDGAFGDDATQGKKTCQLLQYKLVCNFATYALLSCEYVINHSQIALGGRYSRDFFNRYGDLRHIRRLRFWPLNKVLMEKYDFSERDANDMMDFLVPILDFVPEKRPSAGQCLAHPWIAGGPHRLKPCPPSEGKQVDTAAASDKQKREKDEREAMEKGMGSIAISTDPKLGKHPLSSPNKPSKAVVTSEPLPEAVCPGSQVMLCLDEGDPVLLYTRATSALLIHC